MAGSLYDVDTLAWTEQQADLLRRLVAGERVSEAVDWPNLIEEIEALGRSEVHGCESLLRQAMVHLLMLHVWPRSRAAGHWRSETLGFLADAQRGFTPSMRQKIDLGALYSKALRQVQAESDDAGQPEPLPGFCPFSLDDLLIGEPDLKALATRLVQAATPAG